jgi:hypothetical protein
MARTRSFLLLALLIAACEGSPDRSAEAPAVADFDQAGAEEAPAAPPTANTAAQDAPPDTTAPRYLIRRAALRLRVDDYAGARTEVTTLATRFDAYVGGEQEHRYPGRIENTLTLRVPAERFDPLMEALVAVGEEVDFRTVETEDVTRQYVDLEARLGARRAVAERLTALLERADTVEEVLAVQMQLAAVQEQIEAAEAELRYLRNQVSLSTITVTIFEESATGVAAGSPFFTRIGDAFETGWEGVKELVVGLVALWPLWVLVALFVPLYRRMERRRKARRAAAAPAP